MLKVVCGLCEWLNMMLSLTDALPETRVPPSLASTRTTIAHNNKRLSGSIPHTYKCFESCTHQVHSVSGMKRKKQIHTLTSQNSRHMLELTTDEIRVCLFKHWAHTLQPWLSPHHTQPHEPLLCYYASCGEQLFARAIVRRRRQYTKQHSLETAQADRLTFFITQWTRTERNSRVSHTCLRTFAQCLWVCVCDLCVHTSVFMF